MTERERYLFDLMGYILIEGAIDSRTLASMNAWIDDRQDNDSAWVNNYGSLLTWGPEFLDLIDNPRVMPYLKELMGDGLRLDHDYPIFTKQGEHRDSTPLHGGGTPYDPAQYYHCRQGQIFSGLTVVSFALVDIPPGGGGLGCIPGSHKSNFVMPDDIRHYYRQEPYTVVQQVPMKAGDCVIFTEALSHGSIPWKAAHQRRSLFFKFSPGHMSWGKTYYFPGRGNQTAQEIEERLTDSQRALLEPPYASMRNGAK